MAEEGFDIATTMRYAKDEHTLVLDTINDDVVAHGKSPGADTKVLVAGTAQIRMAGKNKKSVGDGIDQMVGDFDASALFGDVVPDTVEVGCGLWRDAVRHTSGEVIARRRGGFGRVVSLPRQGPAWIAA
jgi:hypothetical protein